MLYKFLGDNSEHDRDFETLSRKEFFASSYASLNDPWDAPGNFLSPDLMKNLPNSISKKLAKDLFDGINNYGIYCLSVGNSSQLMWAHYANSWRGLCIEYKYDKKDFVDELTRVFGSDVLIGALPMRYSSSAEYLGVTDFKKKNPYEIVRNLLGQKYIDWAHEKEFRLFFNRSGLFHMPPSMMSGVYLGHAMHESQKEKYIALFSSRGIPVWEARPDTNNFTGGVQTMRLDSSL
ncbi:DUF2971 domain-containing protein [Burkholderia vietnamiensis]|uniref:DUF2971 domain-containing protein n=1 Tax=Burkholderia vietnamiensis TaxID=60552 RepID=UPI000AD50A3C|nr:DUF2971 domain-containing protein [Burkholderia vietnamiensis]